MDMDKAFSGKYLKAADLDGESKVLKMTCVTQEEIGEAKEKKYVLHCADEKPIVLNKTNNDTIKALYGKDSTAWKDQLIEVFPTTTQFGPKIVDCIRMRKPVDTPF